MKQKCILILAYYSYKDPVFQSAVLPYFTGLSDGKDFQFVLLTYEQERYRVMPYEIEEITHYLKGHSIIWYRTTWHSGRFKAIKKAFDFLWSLLYAGNIIHRHKVSAIYSEGFPGAVLGHHLSELFHIPHLVHTFEPHADYMIEAGVWKKNSWEARLLIKYEEIIAKKAKAIFTATNAMIEKLKKSGSKAALYRVPSCVDLDTFRFSEKDRVNIRMENNIRHDECVITYLGKFGGMYMEEEVFDFFRILELESDLKFKYFILTPDDHSSVLKLLKDKQLQSFKFLIKTLRREEVSPYLSASDFGFVAVRQKPSKRYCSPIKNGEYWACGLPIIIPKGISDDYLFASELNLGIVMEDGTEKSKREVAVKVKEWYLQNEKDEVSKRCRSFVEQDRSIEKFQQLYREVFAGTIGESMGSN